ncbi:ATP-binding protein [Aerosakkonema sp. BLCC-F183]|uniref:ATP-binding protein n=1 Tax=Aerosakkonema sp. BLCC-F183 TaxID=3342834 RepID=UPI0035B8F4C2
MKLTEFITANNVNLNNCDREQIHLPGSIQPHGVLFVLSEPDLQVEQVSNNTEIFLGISPDSLLGQNLAILFDDEQIGKIKNCLNGDFENINPLKLSAKFGDITIELDGIIHRADRGKIILEIERTDNLEDRSFFGFHKLTKSTLTKMQKAANLRDLCTVIVAEIRKITGFDRVMAYQFDADGAGTVIAEDKPDELEPYLGLRYPDSDIPKQAKHLYTLNWLRLIPDVNYQPVPIVCHTQDGDNSPLDLSLSVLRSVSPIHIKYLKNMGVGASMSISIIKNRKLWGLIACHDRKPKYIPYSIRTACEFLGQVMSLEITGKEDYENLDYKIRIKSMQSQLIDAVSQSEDFTEVLLENSTTLLGAVGAEGAAICTDKEIIRIGKSPEIVQIQNLLAWLPERFERDLFVTDSLPKIYPKAKNFQAVGSGLLALAISKIRQKYILWFRSEQIQLVDWAGNPNKPNRIESDGSLTIFPRKSFEKWQETVYGKSLPWQPWEIDGALDLRSAIVGIVMQKADELAAINLELQRSNSELDAFAYIASHDLKEPLRGIHNYATFLLEDYGNILNAEGTEKLGTMVRLTKRMEDLINALLHFSRLGRQELNREHIDLNNLVQIVADLLRISSDKNHFLIQIPQKLPMVQGDRILIEEVFTNLITNALKYNESPEKLVEVGFLDNHPPNVKNFMENSPNQFWTIYVRDNGIGIREKHLDSIFRIFKRLHSPGKYGGGTGAGLTIVKKIVERHGGTIWVESNYGEGSTFYFTLPK